MVWEALNELPDIESQIYVVAPFPPPPLIGRVHDLLMTYTKVYRNFCFDVFGKTLLKNTVYDQTYYIYLKYLGKFKSKIESKKYPVLQSKIWPIDKYYELHFMKSMGQDGVLWMSKEQTKEAKLNF